MLCANLPFVYGQISKIILHFRIKIYCFIFLIKVYLKVLSMNFAFFFFSFFNGL